MQSFHVALDCSMPRQSASSRRTHREPCRWHAAALPYIFDIISYYMICYVIISYYMIVYLTLLYYVILYYTILYYVVLHYMIWYHIIPQGGRGSSSSEPTPAGRSPRRGAPAQAGGVGEGPGKLIQMDFVLSALNQPMWWIGKQGLQSTRSTFCRQQYTHTPGGMCLIYMFTIILTKRWFSNMRAKGGISHLS